MNSLTNRNASFKNILLDVDNLDNQSGIDNNEAITSS